MRKILVQFPPGHAIIAYQSHRGIEFGNIKTRFQYYDCRRVLISSSAPAISHINKYSATIYVRGRNKSEDFYIMKLNYGEQRIFAQMAKYYNKTYRNE